MKRRACRWIIKPWNNKSPQNSAINSSAKHGLLHIILDISWNSSDIQYWMQLRRDLDAIYPLLFDWICSEHEWLQIEIHVTNFKLFLIHPSQSWSSNEIDEFVSHKLNFSHTPTLPILARSLLVIAISQIVSFAIFHNSHSHKAPMKKFQFCSFLN